jgi:hypothetical protein
MRATRALLMALLGGGLHATGSAADDAALDRSQLAARRQEVERRFDAEEAACRQRFAVTGCIEDARAQRRLALAPLREREFALDDADRKARAAARRHVAAQKRLAAEARAASAPPVQARTRDPATSTSATAVGGDPAGRPATSREDEAPHAAVRAAAAERRRAEAQAERERIAQRQASRAASGKPAATLPLPPGLPSSAAGR